ncbi:MAG: hypothetical protein WBF20_04350 [Trebonia sp.]|uniref:hypothetical protein n=1 Tax=Trebonia sp. TaxID=2767075 RepID=UPI003C781ABE
MNQTGLAAADGDGVAGIEALAAGVGAFGVAAEADEAAETEEADGAADDAAVPGAETPVWGMLPHAVTAKPRTVPAAARRRYRFMLPPQGITS